MTEIKIAISKRELERIWWEVGGLKSAEAAVREEIDRRLILAGADVKRGELVWWDAVTIDGDEIRVFSWRPVAKGIHRGGDRRVGWVVRLLRRVEGWLWRKEG